MPPPRAFCAEGRGIHTGEPARVEVTPAAPGTGLVFETPRGSIPARPAAIAVNGKRRTDLERGPARVSTVEHLLAALWWYGVGDARILVDGPEIPALDGAAAAWCALLAEAGALPAPRLRPLAAPVEVRGRDGARASLVPVDAPEMALVEVELCYDAPCIDRQRFSFAPVRDDFVTEVAPARTFALHDEVAMLHASGLARGGGLHNALVFGPDGPLNPEGVRFADEPARHKLLDALGDISLLGGLPRARIELIRPGHGLLHSLVHQLDFEDPVPGE